jgi:RHS repeat-associated protein
LRLAVAGRFNAVYALNLEGFSGIYRDVRASVWSGGHRTHISSGLALALYRGYDAGLGQWVSEDPARLQGGANLYAYVAGRVISSWDPLGLQAAAAGGASCCSELQQRRQRIHDIMDGVQGGGGITTAGPYAVSTCSDAGGEYSVLPHTPPCLVECVGAHEGRHVQQCRRFGPTYMGTAAAERSAYMVELGCVIRKIRQLGCECS